MEFMLVLEVLKKSPIAAAEDGSVEAASITELTSIGAMFKELGLALLEKGDDGANAPARGTSATAEQILKIIVMMLL